MKNLKRILALALCLLMVVTMVGCGKKKRQPIKLTLSTEDAEAILNAAGIRLPPVEEAAGANSTVTWFAWYDPFQNYDEGEMVNTGYFTFTEKYGGNIVFDETTYQERNNDLANRIMADTSPDLYPAGASNTANFPLNALNHMYQPVDDWVDLTDPLWEGVADAADYYLLKGKHYAIITYMKFKDVVPYNRRVIEEYGYDDPAELYANDDWTWSKFYEMALDFTDPDANRFGVDGFYVANGIVEQSTGHYIIGRDEEGNYVSNIDDPIIEEGEALIYELSRNDCFFREGTNYWALNNYEHGHGVKDGNVLFWPAEYDLWGNTVEEYAQTYGDLTQQEIMFVPYPRRDDGDGIYYLSTRPDGFSLVQGAPNPEGAVLLASCIRFKMIDPTVVNIDRKQLKEKLLWTDEMLEMFDECTRVAAENVRMFYTGNLPDQLQSTYNSLDWDIVRTSGANTWAQLKERHGERLQYYLDDLNARIAEYTE